MNTYGYVEGNPIKWVDFNGLSKIQDPRNGNDQILLDLKDAARRDDRQAILKIEQDAKNGEYGELSKERTRNVKSWCKIAKDGRLVKTFLGGTVINALAPSAQIACEIDPTSEAC